MKRIFLWPELSPAQQTAALVKLRRLAIGKAGYDGTVLPYAWEERVAPVLRYIVQRDGTIWDCTVTPTHRRRGIHSIFTAPILTMDQLSGPLCSSANSVASILYPQS